MRSPTAPPVVVEIDECTYPIEDLVVPSVAANLLGEHVATVRKRVAAGELPAVKIGPPPADPSRDRRRIRIPLAAVTDLIRPSGSKRVEVSR